MEWGRMTHQLLEGVQVFHSYVNLSEGNTQLFLGSQQQICMKSSSEISLLRAVRPKIVTTCPVELDELQRRRSVIPKDWIATSLECRLAREIMEKKLAFFSSYIYIWCVFS